MDDSEDTPSIWSRIKAAMENQGSQKTYAEKLEEYRKKKKKKQDQAEAATVMKTQAAGQSDKYPDEE